MKEGGRAFMGKRKPPIIELFDHFISYHRRIWDGIVYFFTGIYRCDCCGCKKGLKEPKHNISMSIADMWQVCESCKVNLLDEVRGD